MSLVSGFAGKLGSMASDAGAGAKLGAHLADVGVQAAGVGAGQYAGELASGDTPSAGNALSTAIQMLGVGAAMDAVGVSRRAALHPDPVEGAAEAAAAASDAMRAHRDAQALSDVGQAVKDAPTTASVPDRVKSLIETATGGEDASTVYFQSDDWNRYWSGRGASPAKAAADLMGDGGRAYYESASTGARLAVRLGDYVSKIAPTEHWDGLLPIARTTPDGMSLAEASDYLKSLPATMHELATEASTASLAPDAGQRIASTVEAQLKDAGVAESAAKAQASLYSAAFRTLGERAGVDPLELFNRYNVRITRGVASDRITKAIEAKRLAEEAIAASPELASEDEQAATTLERARTESGRLKSLKTATVDELANEYRTLIDANADENIAPTVTGARPTDYSDGLHVGAKAGAMKAAGRVAARAKSIAKLEAEIERRGFDTSAIYMRGHENAQLADETAFPFGANLEQKGSGAPRGRIVFGDQGVRIELLQHADRSTFIHETGHFYAKVLDDLASRPDAAPAIKADNATMRAWLGADEGKELTREQHEQFARGFEAYLMEGKAPTPELRGVFYRFKRWLVSVYKDLRALNVSLTPEVRRVFDRLLASDEAIRHAERDRGVAPLFDDPSAVGMTETTAATYARAVDDARQSAEEELTARLMHEIRREESAEWDAWRAPIRADVERQVNAEPVYQALEFLRKGTNADGSPLPHGTEPLKLSRDDVVAMVGKDAAGALPKEVYGKPGVSADVVADLFGFSSGRDLVDALRETPSRVRAIEARTDERTRDEHGERLTDADVYAKATEALHGEHRAQLLRKELEYLASKELATFKGLVRSVTKTIPPSDVVRAQAAEIVGAKRVRDLRPDLLEKAAARAGRDARERLLRGDVAGAFEAKRQELLTTEVFNAATRAKQSVETALDEFRKLFGRDERLAETRDLDLVNAARAIAAAFGVGRTDKPAAAYLSCRRAALAPPRGALGRRDGFGRGERRFRRFIWNPISEGDAVPPRQARGDDRDTGSRSRRASRADERRPIPAPELGYEFNGKAELLGALLHTGNESNLSKLLRGRGWGSVDEFGASIARAGTRSRAAAREGVLGKPDYDYVQGVWDLFES
jgi:hypothetical protein